MPENYLQLAGDVVGALGRAENNQTLQFNEIQCRLLRQQLQETVTPLLSRVDMDSLPAEKQALFQQCCQAAALLELYRDSQACRGNHTRLQHPRLAYGSNQVGT
ncbi:unnamed protein product [Sphagnum troendelagicum]